jgi:GGDEF domain-containing protein
MGGGGLMAKGFSIDDYVDVAERIQNLFDKYPDASLQTIDWGVQEIGGKSFVWYRAAAYRTPDDERPGQGIAWEPFPGPTPYTKDSELMNAETSAYGRAICALGLVSNRKLASRQEVRARMGDERTAPGEMVMDPKPKRKPKAKPASTPTERGGEMLTVDRVQEKSDAAVDQIIALYNRSGFEPDILKMQLAAVDADNSGTPEEALRYLNADQFKTVWEVLTEAATERTV